MARHEGLEGFSRAMAQFLLPLGAVIFAISGGTATGVLKFLYSDDALTSLTGVIGGGAAGYGLWRWRMNPVYQDFKK